MRVSELGLVIFCPFGVRVGDGDRFAFLAESKELIDSEKSF